MIQTYGLHWHINKVYWGKQKSPGLLLGSASRKAKSIAINFRDQRGIYILYANYQIVYIGQAGSGQNRLLNRLREHRRDHLAERWDRFSWFGTKRVLESHTLSADTENIQGQTIVSALNMLEAVTTAIAEPKLNLQRGKWGDAKQYFQVVAKDSLDYEMKYPEEIYEDDE